MTFGHFQTSVPHPLPCLGQYQAACPLHEPGLRPAAAELNAYHGLLAQTPADQADAKRNSLAFLGIAKQ